MTAPMHWPAAAAPYKGKIRDEHGRPLTGFIPTRRTQKRETMTVCNSGNVMTRYS